MDQTDRDIINSLHGGLAICEHPYQEAALRLGLSEDELLARLVRMLEAGVLTRVGPLYQIERMGGAFTQVAHNYARDHELNMWFVIATETPGEIDAVIAQIERETGCDVFNFPKSREYFVELKLKA